MGHVGVSPTKQTLLLGGGIINKVILIHYSYTKSMLVMMSSYTVGTWGDGILSDAKDLHRVNVFESATPWFPSGYELNFHF